jgi:hypothetical protein
VLYYRLMRFGGGLLAVTGLTLVLAVPGNDAARPLTLNGPERQTKETVAFIWRDDGVRIARVDERTLTRVGPLGARLNLVSAWAIAKPAGNLLAVATHPSGIETKDSLRFVDLRSLRPVRRTVPLDGYTRALLWARLDRVVALTSYCCTPGTSVFTVDTGARRVVSRRELANDVIAVRRAADALVLLETPRNQIGPARLEVVAADGSLRSVGLDRVRAGNMWPQDGTVTEPIGTTREPALAVDPDGHRAFVIQPDGPAAEVDLRTLAVSCHDPTAPRSLLARFSAWLTPAAEAKGMNGPRWSGRWLGDGLIAVAGTEETASKDANNQFVAGASPLGLAIVDTHDWTIRMLDRGADTVTQAEGLLLATGTRWSSTERKTTGMGLAAYGADRSLRFRLFDGTSSWVAAVSSGRAYVSGPRGQHTLVVVDLASGKAVGTRPDPVPTPILADGPDF